jgi:hypothetical protein
MGGSTVRLSGGNGGWISIDDAEGELGLPGRIYFRLTEVEGIDRITELYIDGRGEPLQQGAFRRFPLAVLESAIESMHFRGVAGPDLSRLASYYAHTWGSYRGRHCTTCSAPLRGTASHAEQLGRERAIDNWVELAYLSQSPRDDFHVPLPPMNDKRRRTGVDLPEFRLTYENGQALTDAFLSDVARAYEAAIARGLPPAEAISKLVGVQRKTVQSWVYKARKRDIMPPAKSRGRIV